VSTLEDDASAAYRSAHQLVLKLAQDGGAEIRQRPAWPGSYSVVRYAEPLAGLKAAVVASKATGRVTGDYITRAREDGFSWLEIGRALGIDGEPYDVAVSAFERAAGEGSPGWGPSFSFTCGSCAQMVTDHGPYTASPLDCEEGHAEDCTRMAEAMRAYRDQWEDGGGG